MRGNESVNPTEKIRGGALLARAFREKGVEHAFTLAGGFCNPALEGFMECQMPVINCPHEQVAGHLADGHTRITRKPSVCLVGPEGLREQVFGRVLVLLEDIETEPSLLSYMVIQHLA